MELLTILFVWFIGYIVGWLSHSHSMIKRILKNPDYMINLLEKYKNAKKDEESSDNVSILSDIREIEIQKENSSFYLYAKDNGEFLGQGTTLDQALEVVKQRFPGQNFSGHIPAEQATAMGLSKQQ
jgi:hypothetical protein